jgi:TatD DNase family protein
MIYNTHSHLQDDSFDDIRSSLIDATLNSGMKVLLIGFTPEMNRKAIELAERYDHFLVAVGIHPNHANEWQKDLELVKQYITHPKVVAIGECGLDYHWDTVSPAIQKEAFIAQIELANETGLPLIIHMRDAQEDTLAVLKEYANGKGIMHCYSGDEEHANAFISLGFSLGIGGPVTFKNNQAYREMIQRIGMDHLVVETDDPYLAPHPLRGKQNIVTHVTYVIDELARMFHQDVSMIEQMTATNAEKILGGTK